jgi:hypothetical protein
MSDYPRDSADSVGDLGNGPEDPTQLEAEADLVADLMSADEDPLPDAQVPGVGPDSQAPTTPA